MKKDNLINDIYNKLIKLLLQRSWYTKNTYEITPLPYINNLKSDNSKDSFYMHFENVFRGNEILISERQKTYLKYIYPLKFNSKYFLDIGCGRGEFLKLLIETGINAKGIEINKIEYEMLTAQGLNVNLEDAITYLSSIEDDSLTGVSAFQIIEHLTFQEFERFIELCYRKVFNNGIIIIETINPKCSLALSNFYIDPTHIRPYPFELSKFMLEWYGFKDIIVIFSSPCRKRQKNSINQQNYMDYSVIGYKR